MSNDLVPYLPMIYPILTLQDNAMIAVAHIRLDLIAQCVECLDEAGTSIVEVFYTTGHREVYGACTAAPIVAWFAAQADRFAQVQAFPKPSYDPRLDALVHGEKMEVHHG